MSTPVDSSQNFDKDYYKQHMVMSPSLLDLCGNVSIKKHAIALEYISNILVELFWEYFLS